MEESDPQWTVEQIERIDRELDTLRREVRELRANRFAQSQAAYPGHDITDLEGKPRDAYFLLLRAHTRGDQPNAIITSSERNGEYDHRVMIHRVTAETLVRRGFAEEVTWDQSQEDARRPHGLYLAVGDAN